MGAVGATIVVAIISSGVLFIYTEAGEQISTQMDEISDTVNELDWYTFPLQAQRMMPIIILTTQHPPVLAAYGGILCTRETFKKVCHSK